MTVAERAEADEKLALGLEKGATPPPPGDWVVMKEEAPRWRGALAGGGKHALYLNLSQLLSSSL